MAGGNDLSYLIHQFGLLREQLERLSSTFAGQAGTAHPEYALFRAMADNAPDMIWAKDTQKRYLFANQAICDKLLCATDSSEPLGKTDLFFADRERQSHPDDRDWHTFGEICADSDAIVLNSGKAERFDEFGNVRGKLMHLDVYKAPFRDPDGNLLGTLGYGRIVTHTKETERALHESEMLFKAIFNHAGMGIAISSPEGHLVSVNPAFAALYGYTPEEMSGMACEGLSHPDDLAENEQFSNKIRNRKLDSYTLEKRILNRQKEISWIRVNATALRRQNGELLYKVCNVEDITDQRENRKQLEIQRQRLYNLLEQLPYLVYLQAPDYSIRFANKVFTDRFGDYRKDDCFQIIYGRSEPCENCSTLKVLKTGEKRTWDLQDERDGRYYEIHEIPFTDPDGSELILVLGADITERKLARQTLEASELYQRSRAEQYQALFDALPDALIEFDEKMHIQSANHSATMMFAGDGEDLVGDSCYQLVCRGKQICEDCLVRRCFNSGKVEQGEIFDNQGGTLQLRAFPMNSVQDGGRRVILLAHDNRRRLQERVSALRAGQLASIGELAAGVAHEINNPITGILNYADMLAKPNLPQGLRDEIPSRIALEGERVATIVAGLLDFSRKKRDEISECSVADIVRNVLILVETQMRVEGILVESRIADDLPPLQARQQQIEQLLFNLFSNARHALNQRYNTEHPDKRIILSVETSGESRIRFSVRDFGTGIPTEHHQSIFSPFFTTKPEGEGTGLGLSICWEIVTAHGGSIEVKSEIDRFTEVVVELPTRP